MTADPNATLADGLFERLVVSLVRQQVSMAAAAAIRDRLFEAVTVTPEGILAADRETLHEAGLSEAKVDYVTRTASAFAEREWDRDTFAGMSDNEVRTELTEIKGIGPWTADMFLLFGLAREDVFPVGDLGIRKGMKRLHDAELTRGEMTDAAERWHPYRSYASLYLWLTVED